VKHQTVWNAQKSVKCTGKKIFSNLTQFVFLSERNIFFLQ